MYKVFIEKDCEMVEINPLVQLTDGRVMAADSKVGIEDNAAFR
jgi:succinyl-CoA synthetase beta subunit